MTAISKPIIDWPDTIYSILGRVGIRVVGYVPDAGHARLIQLCENDPNFADVVLTTEEEGVGLVTGALLGGQRAALLMQSSGVGNCINVFSLIQQCRLPCFVLVTMRGEYAEFNPWQISMGSITEASLHLCKFLTYRVDKAEDAGDTISAAADICFESRMPVAVLLSQRLIGRKRWTN